MTSEQFNMNVKYNVINNLKMKEVKSDTFNQILAFKSQLMVYK